MAREKGKARGGRASAIPGQRGAQAGIEEEKRGRSGELLTHLRHHPTMVTRHDDKRRHLPLRFLGLLQIPQPDVVVRSDEDVSSRGQGRDGRDGAGGGGETESLNCRGGRGGVPDIVDVDDGGTATDVDLLAISGPSGL